MATLRLNGKDVSLPEDPRTTLLDFLHQHLSLFGTKKGCDHGQCGACTVIVDGERVNACLVFAFQLEDCEVTTIEGIANNDALHPLQQAFIERDAFQCGYCTSGQLCSGVSLLNELKSGAPSAVTYSNRASLKEDISERMSGNLCRCGAYPNIVDAITDVIALERQ
ncbi:MAG: 2Fe-2S iron-sulfur cluster binding domain-containing protein [Gammaproteobacteria bacterium]|jgi:xanthine dehydrogenase YagT iron-sulfur-binding subunit|nr:2Fe-2S iron-sulfur cluster binding domain-containing protein [Gammaproteobacteria bacterium]